METTSGSSMMTTRVFDWRLFLILGILGILASFLIIPYSMALDNQTGQIQPSILIAGQACSGMLLLPLIALGLLAGHKVDLGSPILQSILNHRSVKDFAGKALLWGFVLGLIGGGVIIGISTVSEPLLKAEYVRLGLESPEVQTPAPWQGFLAAISAGITEEVLMRLFLMTGLIWLGRLIWHTPDGKPRRWIVWTANIASALGFGLLHFPLAFSLGLGTPFNLLHILLMNGLAGVLFGWLYERHGLESAIMGHFSTDLMLHVLLPMLSMGS